MATSNFNKRSAGVKRLLAEVRELSEPSSDIVAAPVEDNLFEWHFTIRLSDGDFKGGCYHGRLLLPTEYPMKPPDIMLLTPSGRFELNKKICLSITGYHAETWQPAWGIKTALIALQSFFTTEAKGAIGGLDAPPDERQRLAKLSKEWTCPTCGVKNEELLAETPAESTAPVEAVEEVAESRPIPPSLPLPLLSPPPEVHQSPMPTPTLNIPTHSAVPISVVDTAEQHDEREESPVDDVRRPPPVWLDGLIGLLVALLAVLVLRRLW